MPLRTDLAAYLRQQSRWREAKAEMHPGDDRHARSARALAEAADYIERLPDNDGRLRRLEAFACYSGGVFRALEESSRVISGYGLDRTGRLSPDRLLSDLLTACERENAGYELRR